MTRPVSRVGSSSSQVGMASQTSQLRKPAVPPPARHSVGPSTPPTHASVAVSQLRPSSAQSKVLPQSSTATPQAQPRSSQLVAASHSTTGSASHWNGSKSPQYSSSAQPPESSAQS